MNIRWRISSFHTVLFICISYALLSFNIRFNIADYYAVCDSSDNASVKLGMITRHVYKSRESLRLCDPKRDTILIGETAVLNDNDPSNSVVVWDCYLISKRSNDTTTCLVLSRDIFKGAYRSSAYKILDGGVEDIMSTGFAVTTGEVLPFMFVLYHMVVGVIGIGVLIKLISAICFKNYGLKTRVYTVLTDSRQKIAGKLPELRVGLICAASAHTIAHLYTGMYQQPMYIPIMPFVTLPCVALVCAVCCVIFGMTGKDGVKIYWFVCVLSITWLVAIMSPFLHVVDVPVIIARYSIVTTILFIVLGSVAVHKTQVARHMYYAHSSLVYVVFQMFVFRLAAIIVKALASP